MQIRRMVLAPATIAAAVGLASGGVAVAEPAHDPQTLYFNHGYGVIDRTTADAIEHSDYLRTFANFELRTTTGADGSTWTGRYLYGRETYLELLGVGDIGGYPYGQVGLAVSVENDGELATVEQRLDDPYTAVQTRDFGDGIPVPWFDFVYTTEDLDGFFAWAMEWRDEYFADPRGKTEPPDHPGDVGRERYLNDGYRERLMRDVTGVHMALTAKDLANTLPLLEAGGYRVRTTPGGAVAQGGGTTLYFDAVPLDQIGLRQVDFSLNRFAHRHVEQIGQSTLVVGPGKRAVWTFPDVQ